MDAIPAKRAWLPNEAVDLGFEAFYPFVRWALLVLCFILSRPWRACIQA
jgi:hypothetical protein